jgi:hypothetical protein
MQKIAANPVVAELREHSAPRRGEDTEVVFLSASCERHVQA